MRRIRVHTRSAFRAAAGLAAVACLAACQPGSCEMSNGYSLSARPVPHATVSLRPAAAAVRLPARH